MLSEKRKLIKLVFLSGYHYITRLNEGQGKVNNDAEEKSKMEDTKPKHIRHVHIYSTVPNCRGDRNKRGDWKH